MGKLRDALRKKYRTPREAAEALGLDAKLLDVPRLAFDGAKHMKPNRLQYLVAKGIAQSINPLLAKDAKVDYTPLFAGLTSKTVKARSKTIVTDAKKLLKGKTIAKDASVEHLAHMLDQFEHVPDQASLDVSVSEPQHRAMEAAAHGASNLGIPKDVGKEFAEADKGKSFDEMLMDWAKDRGMSEDDLSDLKKMHADSMPENALDEKEEAEDADETDEEKEEREKKEKEAKDAKDAAEAEEKEKAAKDKSAKDKHAMDKRLEGMVTKDSMEKAITDAVAKERKSNQDAAEARSFVRSYVGEVSMALDTAEKIHRAAAMALATDGKLDVDAEELKTLPAAALKTLIKQAGRSMADDDASGMANDSAGGDDETKSGWDERWGDSAGRIGLA